MWYQLGEDPGGLVPAVQAAHGVAALEAAPVEEGEAGRVAGGALLVRPVELAARAGRHPAHLHPIQFSRDTPYTRPTRHCLVLFACLHWTAPPQVLLQGDQAGRAGRLTPSCRLTTTHTCNTHLHCGAADPAPSILLCRYKEESGVGSEHLPFFILNQFSRLSKFQRINTR